MNHRSGGRPPGLQILAGAPQKTHAAHTPEHPINTCAAETDSHIAFSAQLYGFTASRSVCPISRQVYTYIGHCQAFLRRAGINKLRLLSSQATPVGLSSRSASARDSEGQDFATVQNLATFCLIPARIPRAGQRAGGRHSIRNSRGNFPDTQELPLFRRRSLSIHLAPPVVVNCFGGCRLVPVNNGSNYA